METESHHPTRDQRSARVIVLFIALNLLSWPLLAAPAANAPEEEPHMTPQQEQAARNLLWQALQGTAPKGEFPAPRATDENELVTQASAPPPPPPRTADSASRQSEQDRGGRQIVMRTSEEVAAEESAQAPKDDIPRPSTEATTPPPESPDTDADAAESAPEEEEVDASELLNWVELAVGGTFLDGDKAQFMKRHRLPSGAFGGIKDFHYEKPVGEDAMFRVDGRALFDLHDYKVKLDLTHPEKGFVRAGYTEFRTWYDGTGSGYLTIPPPSGTWISLYDDNLHVDRGEAWFEAGLTLPDVPIVKFRYSHQFREGKKDSTIWGDRDTTGAINQSGLRGIVPSFRELDERRNIFELSAAHTIKSTDLGLGFRYEITDIQNSLNVRRRPGEPAADRYATTKEGNESDLFSVHGYSLTRFNEKVVLTAGAAYTAMDSDISGSRFYGSGYDMGYDPGFPANRQFFDQGYTNLTGGSKLYEYVVNLNLMYNPWNHFSLVPSLRVQRQDVESSSSFLDTMDAPPGPLLPVASSANSDRGLLEVAPRLDLRYSGVTNWLFYGRGEWAHDQGDINENFTGRIATGSYVRNTDYRKFTQKYTAGINWYPLRRLNFGTQYYYKMRDNNYDHTRSPVSYPGFIQEQDFNTHDVNFRVTWRPLNNLTLISRYDFQISTIDSQGTGLSSVQSADMTSHIFGESITWAPFSRLYFQAGANLVFDRTETPANDLTGSAENLVLPSKNNYWNANLMSGYSLNEKTDLLANYFYYRANNFVDNSLQSVPYGADMQEHVVTATLSRRINERTRVNLKYGYFMYEEDASGGNNNYDAHLIYSSILYLF